MDNENNHDEINFRLRNEEENHIENTVDDYYKPDVSRGYNNNYESKKKRGYPSYFLVSIVSAIIGGLLTSFLVPMFQGNYGAEGKYLGNTQEIKITPKDDMTAVEAVAKKSMKSVVGITTTDTIQDFIFGERPIQGVGSGIIVDSEGYILTNSHVIGDGSAQNITVMFENEDKKPGKVMWFEKALDLAIVKVDGNNYPAAEIGNSDTLNIGELAVAIGNPLGLDFERTVTSGIISGLNRTIQIDEGNKVENLIQTNAAINSGNSGGPLLNNKGQVIGINTLKLKAAEGLGFAIPINVVKPIIDQVVSQGKYTSVYVGIGGDSVAKYRAAGIEVGVKDGIVISQVEPESPADKAGIKKMNIMVSFGGKEINSLETLRKEMYKYKPGDKVKAVVIKEGKKVDVEIMLGEKIEE